MIKVLIQVAGGSSDRRIYDERTLEYKETRQGSIPYIYPYGFILGTRAEDDCSVDCYIITHQSLQAGSIVECEPFGLLEQDEGGEIDHKILASLPDEKLETYCRARKRCVTSRSIAKSKLWLNLQSLTQRVSDWLFQQLVNSSRSLAQSSYLVISQLEIHRASVIISLSRLVTPEQVIVKYVRSYVDEKDSQQNGQVDQSYIIK